MTEITYADWIIADRKLWYTTWYRFYGAILWFLPGVLYSLRLGGVPIHDYLIMLAWWGFWIHIIGAVLMSLQVSDENKKVKKMMEWSDD